MRRFRVDAVAPVGARITLPSETSHHLLRVVGIAPGEEVELFDGSGQVARAHLVGVDRDQATLIVIGHLPAVASASRYLLVGVVRPAPMEIIVRMGTELGVTHVWPVWTERTVRRGAEKQSRWTRIAEGAAAQCGRASVPEIAPPTTLDAALDAVPADVSQRFVGVPLDPTRPEVHRGPAALLIGSEGGLTPGEIALAGSRGFLPFGAGPHTLRTETAAIAALAWLDRA